MAWVSVLYPAVLGMLDGFSESGAASLSPHMAEFLTSVVSSFYFSRWIALMMHVRHVLPSF